MKPEEDVFPPETVDEQVEQLSRSLYAIPSRQRRTADAQLVQNLHRMYEMEQQDARSMERVQRHLEQQGWLAPEGRRGSRPAEGRHPERRRAYGPAIQATTSREPPTGRQRGWMFRLAALAAVLLVTTLVGGLVVGLVLMRQGNGSKLAPTATPLPLAPPSIYGVDNNAVFALNPADGKTRWQYAFTPATTAQLSYVREAEDVLYLQVGGDVLTALNKNDGSVLWQRQDASLMQAAKGLAIVTSPISQNTGPTFIAYDSRTGKKLWTFQAPRGNAYSYASQGFVLTTDAVYALTEDNPSTADNQPHFFLYALDRANGKERWSFQAPFDFGSVTASGDTVYITGGVAPPVGLIALNASDGTERWHANNPDDNSTAFQVPMVVNGVVYVPRNGYVQSGGGPATLVALQASDGKELWHSMPAQANVAYSEPTVVNGVVYATDEQYAYAFNATNGSLLWQKQLGRVDYATPIVSGNILYLPWRENVALDQAHYGLVALDTGDGHEIWRYSQPPSTVHIDPGAEDYTGPGDDTLLDNVILIHNAAGVLVGLNATTGQELWQSSLFSLHGS